MKVSVKIKTKPCPFCGGKINMTHGFIKASFWFFKCRVCGATIAFDNNECNTEPNKAKEYFERRVAND